MNRPLFGRVIIAAFVILTIPAIIFYLDWRIPRATAVIQVHPARLSFSLENATMTRAYMESEFETVTSDETLSHAAKDLGITDDEIFDMEGDIAASPIRGTDFIEITVKNLDGEKAARIANAIAEAYAHRRAVVAKSRNEAAHQALEEELKRQEKLVADQRKKLVEILRSCGLSFPAKGKPFAKSNTLIFGDTGDQVEQAPRRDEYDQTMANFNSSREMLQAMSVKIEEERVRIDEPFVPITIHKRAQQE